MNGFRRGGTGRDPIGPRRVSGMIGNILLGVLLVPLGLYLGVRHGGWSWLILVIGLLLIAVQGLEFYLDPIGGPRRRLRVRRNR